MLDESRKPSGPSRVTTGESEASHGPSVRCWKVTSSSAEMLADCSEDETMRMRCEVLSVMRLSYSIFYWIVVRRRASAVVYLARESGACGLVDAEAEAII